MRVGRNRSATRRYIVVGTPDVAAIKQFKGRELTAYLRAAWGDVDADGWWLQALAATVQHVEDDSAAASATTPDPDTVVAQGQFVGSVGVNRGPLRFAASARYRTMNGDARISPSLRASYTRGILALGGFVEQRGPDSTSRLDAALRLSPLDWLYVAGAFSRHRPDEALAGGSERTNLRGEVGVTVRARTLRLGVISHSEAQAPGLQVFDSTYGPATQAAGQAIEVGFSGPIVGPFSFEVRALDWSESAIYRPDNEIRSELRVSTDLKRYLPRGNFFMTAAVTHEWRSDLLAPDGLGGTERAAGAGVYGTLLDIRIGTAHIFWYNRNFTGRVYETVPGYLMPRLVQLYGIRWEFWN
jgi:hypothetical protein